MSVIVNVPGLNVPVFDNSGAWVAVSIRAEPDGSEVKGDAILVASLGLGPFSGYSNSIAILGGNSEWLFIAPKEGQQAYISDQNQLQEFDGTSWGVIPSTSDALQKAANLSDVANPATARTNLGVASIDDILFAKGPVELVANTPDASPTVGMRRLIGTSPTGVWVGKSNQVAEYFADGWHYSGSPVPGQTLILNSTGIVYALNPTSLTWVAIYGSLAAAPSAASLDAACASAGVEWRIDTNLTLVANTTFAARIIGYGGVISVNGHTLTLSSLYEAPDRSQLFDVSVTSSLVTCVDGQYAQPEHFGWLGGGGDGGNAALSLNSFQGAKDFGVGVYTTSKSLILDDKHHIRGMGWRSQIKVANGANVPAISTKNFSNFVANQDYGVFPEDFSIENICVNGNALTSVNDEGDAGNTTNDGIQIAATRYLLKNVYVFGAGGHGINSPVNNDSTNKPTSPYDRTVQNEAIWQNIHATRNGGNGINYGGPNDAWLDVIFTYTNLGKGLYVYNSSFTNIGFIHSYSNHGRNCHIDTGASLRVTQGHYRDGLIENLVIDGSYFGSYVLCNDAWISGSPQYSVIINGQTHIGIAEIQTNNGESGINITAGSTTIDIGKLECYFSSGTAGAVGVNYASTAKVKIKGTIAGFADNLVSNNGQGNMWELSLTTTSTSYGLKLSRDNSAQDGNFWKISYTGAYLIDPGGGVTTFNERDYVEVLHVNGSGARSHNSILADQVCAVDSAGIKGPFTVAHGLVQAPNVGNISANFYKGGGTYARDWMGNILIESADATNITYYVNVGTASATSGAKGSVKFTAKIGGMYV